MRRGLWAKLGTLSLGLTVLAGCGSAHAAGASSSSSSAPPLPKPSGAAVSGSFTIGPPSVATYTAHETFVAIHLPHAPVGTTTGVSGTLALANGRFASSTVTVNLTGLHTHQPLRDQHVQDALDTVKYPDAVFKVTGQSANSETVRADGIATVELQGQMTVHGETHTAIWDLQVGMSSSGALDVKGTREVQMTSFGVKPPSIAGFVNVDDAILLGVNLVAQPAAAG